MLWLLVGLCGLALVNLSAPLPQAAITQKPRFYGVMERRRAIIYCEYPLDPLDPPLLVDWFWAKDSDSVARAPMRPTGKVAIKGKTERKHAFLFLKDVSPSNSGVYYCQVNGTWGAGTGLQVMRCGTVRKGAVRIAFPPPKVGVTRTEPYSFCPRLQYSSVGVLRRLKGCRKIRATHPLR
ncbi:uncharacterized protein LOC130371528 isoform X2 [Gadus chalcogrammus]|uniref:uncharacterized protein LOC130371528 isoform X2 n=1 Tax=Gadus chalcogrammus TaxID=1042646 RepID=UPI0024C4D1D0|nr:uncharacterized protein LOC130371528 isoform X2 [Gadus chalcogrammus]